VASSSVAAGWLSKSDDSASVRKDIQPVARTTGAPPISSGKSGRKPSFLHQQSPLFGQEFPSLTGESPVAPKAAASGSSGVGQQMAKPPANNNGTLPINAAPAVASSGTRKGPDAKYGPGPNLRPQTFGNWQFGGGKTDDNGNAAAAANAAPVNSARGGMARSDRNSNDHHGKCVLLSK